MYHITRKIRTHNYQNGSPMLRGGGRVRGVTDPGALGERGP